MFGPDFDQLRCADANCDWPGLKLDWSIQFANAFREEQGRVVLVVLYLIKINLGAVLRPLGRAN